MLELRGEPRRILLNAMNLVVGGKYVVDDENVTQLRDLVGYFTRTGGNLNYRKSILLLGNPGGGKTLLMEVFAQLVRNTPWKYKQITCPEAVVQYSSAGDRVHAMWSGNYFFDDLGHEKPGNHFGKVELMHDVVFDRYNRWVKSGTYTHFTTNKSPDYISVRYGPHCWSRIQQMCNIIGFGNKSTSPNRRLLSDPVPLMGINFPKFFISEEEERIEKELQDVRDRYKYIKDHPEEQLPFDRAKYLRDQFDQMLKPPPEQ